MFGHARHDGPPKHFRAGGSPYTFALPHRDKRALRKEIEAALAQEQGETGGRAARSKGYADAVATLRAVPFDKSAFEAVLARQFGVAEKFQSASRTVLADHVFQMTDAERADYAERLEEVLSRRDRWKDRKRRD